MSARRKLETHTHTCILRSQHLCLGGCSCVSMHRWRSRIRQDIETSGDWGYQRLIEASQACVWQHSVAADHAFSARAS